ncbi:MAG: cryptochrome/photolyase family protein, partial [Gammaproteobacteria bacterium]
MADNPGFHSACTSGSPILACYVFDERGSASRRLGGASRWWLHHSIAALQNSLKRMGGILILRSGSWSEQLTGLATEVGAHAVYWSRAYEPEAIRAEALTEQELKRYGIEARRFRGYLLHEPEQIQTRSHGPFKVFTPFWKACLQQLEPLQPLPVPNRVKFYSLIPASEVLEHWNLLPTTPDWAGGLRENWIPGERGAIDRLDRFLDEAIGEYADRRDFPAYAGTSRLSPHLHFGEISPRQIWHSVKAQELIDGRTQKSLDAFLRELGWREFAYHLLYHRPDLPEHPFRPDYADFPWRKDPEIIPIWQHGRTGIPIVDAGMRELWKTGWMHNRVRMLVASFLVKNLLQAWQAGESWFWDTLV